MVSKKITGLALALFVASFVGCKDNQPANEATTTETPDTTTVAQEQEPTKPEETEIWEPKPPKVSTENGIPSDAIVLFDGSSLDAWVSTKDTAAAADWTLNGDGSMTVKNGFGDIQTKQTFGDVQLHVEWKNPPNPTATNQNRANSGIFLQGLYEVQVLDNYDNETYVNGQVASIYKQSIPLVNAAKPSGEWQVYDIIYHAPEFDGAGNKVKSATVTVLHNGVLVQDHVEIKGTTEYIGWPKNNPHGNGPLKLQDHNDHSGVSYRNIWIREL